MNLKALAAAAAVLSLAAGAASAQAPAHGKTAPVEIAEGTAFNLRLEDTISSRSAKEGDRFTVSLVDDVVLPDGAVLPAGLRGKGKVVDARGNGFLGQTGKLRIRVDYLKVGDSYVPLRAVKGKRGDHRTGTQVLAALIFWPVTPLIRGENTAIRRGTILTAFADADVTVDVAAVERDPDAPAWAAAEPAPAFARGRPGDAETARAEAEADAGRTLARR